MEWFSKWFSINPQIAFPTTGALSIGIVLGIMKAVSWSMKFGYVPRKEAYREFQLKETSKDNVQKLSSEINQLRMTVNTRFVDFNDKLDLIVKFTKQNGQ